MASNMPTTPPEQWAPDVLLAQYHLIQKKCDGLKSISKKLMLERKSLHAQVATLTAAAEAAATVTAAASPTSSGTKHVTVAADVADTAANAAAERVTALEADIVSLRTANAEQLAQLEQARAVATTTTSELTAERAQQVEQMAALKSRVHDVQAENRALKSTTTTMQEQLVIVQQQLDAATTARGEAVLKATTLEETMDSLTKQFEEERLRQKQEQEKQQEQQKAAAKASATVPATDNTKDPEPVPAPASSTQESEASVAAATIAKQKSLLKALHTKYKSVLAAHKTKSDELADAVAALATATTELSSSRAALDALQQTHDALLVSHAELTTSLADITATRNAATEKIDALQSQVATLTLAVATAVDDDAKDKSAAAAEKPTKGTDAHASGDVEGDAAVIASLKADLRDMKRKLRDAEQTTSEVREECEDVVQQLDESATKLTASKKREKSGAAELREARGTIASIDACVRAGLTEHAAAFARTYPMPAQQAAVSLVDKVEFLISHIKDQQDINADATHIIQAAKKQLSEAESRHSDVADTLASLRTQNQTLQTNAAAAEEKIKKLKNLLVRANRHIEANKQKSSSAAQSAQASDAVVMALRRRVRDHWCCPSRSTVAAAVLQEQRQQQQAQSATTTKTVMGTAQIQRRDSGAGRASVGADATTAVKGDDNDNDIDVNDVDVEMLDVLHRVRVGDVYWCLIGLSSSSSSSSLSSPLCFWTRQTMFLSRKLEAATSDTVAGNGGDSATTTDAGDIINATDNASSLVDEAYTLVDGTELPEEAASLLRRQLDVDFNAKWQQRSTALLMQIDELQTEVARANDKVTALTQEHARYKTRAHSVLEHQTSELAKCQNDTMRVQSLTVENQLLTEQVAALKQSLESSSASSASLQQQVTTLTDLINAARTEASRRTEQHTSLVVQNEANIAEANARHAAAVAQWERKLRSRDDETAALRGKYDEMLREQHELNASQQTEIAELQHKLEAFEQTAATMLTNSQSEADSKQQPQQLDQDLQQEQNAIQQSDAPPSEHIIRLQTMLRDSEADATQLRQQLLQANSRLVDVERQLTRLQMFSSPSSSADNGDVKRDVKRNGDGASSSGSGDGVAGDGGSISTQQQDTRTDIQHVRNMNVEYVKQTVLKYIETHDESLFPVIAQLLQFSPVEHARVNRIVADRVQAEQQGVLGTLGLPSLW